jgi:hypothetical protein
MHRAALHVISSSGTRKYIVAPGQQINFITTLSFWQSNIIGSLYMLQFYKYHMCVKKDNTPSILFLLLSTISSNLY